MNKTSIVWACALGAAVFAADANARDQIRIVGSSTVFPFSAAVAEEYGKTTKFKTPHVESTGTGGGFKLFCAGVGSQHPDISNASRRIKASEVDDCRKNGVAEITELKVGYDGIVIANATAAPRQSFTLRQIYLALAKSVPVGGKFVANPYKTWKDVDPSLPDTKIEVLGPPPTSGTRDAFVELAMEGGCQTFPEIAALKKTDEASYKAVCHGVREAPHFIEAGENDNLIVQKLVANKNAFGVFGFSFLDQNSDLVQGSKIGDIEPSFENIADGAYPVSRPLYFYVKNAHVGVIQGIPEFLAAFMNEKSIGEFGYLTDKGLIPMPDAERKSFQADAKSLRPLTLAAGK